MFKKVMVYGYIFILKLKKIIYHLLDKRKRKIAKCRSFFSKKLISSAKNGLIKISSSFAHIFFEFDIIAENIKNLSFIV